VAARPRVRRGALSPVYNRLLVRPCALAGSQYEWPAAVACLLALGAVLTFELMTPSVVVGALALAPLIVANWSLSGRTAGVVSGAGIIAFVIAVVGDPDGRISIIVLGITVLCAVAVTRVYATGLARLLTSQRRIRWGVTPIPLGPKNLPGDDQTWRGVASLTRRELEVARWAAEGYTAGEIAMQLHISDRTVESHLSATYAKLRVRSRTELIRLATRLQLD